MRLNQKGSVLLNAIVASLVIGGLSAVIMQQASQSQGYARLARVKSAMFNAEAKMRALAIEPSSYVNCDGTDPGTCQFNSSLTTGSVIPVAGAKCPNGGTGCGIRLVSVGFTGSNRQFNARLHYDGEELPLRDIEIQNLIVPYETLAQAAMLCPPTSPLFKGIEDGRPVCGNLTNATCPAGQWATRVDPNTMAVTCIPLPTNLTCPAGQYVSEITYSTTGLQVRCAPRADVYVFNNFDPRTKLGLGTTTTFPPGPTDPPDRSQNFYTLEAGCFLTQSQCESASGGAGSCTASTELVYRTVNGTGGTSFFDRMCDVAWPGSLRDTACSPLGNTTYVWDECLYDRYGDVDWNQPYMRTNYRCEPQQWCPNAVAPTTTTNPTALCYSRDMRCDTGSGCYDYGLLYGTFNEMRNWCSLNGHGTYNDCQNPNPFPVYAGDPDAGNCGSPTTTSTTLAASCRWSCTSTDAECTPGPVAGCSYDQTIAAMGISDLRGTACHHQGQVFNFQRTGTGTCDIGWLDCDCSGGTTTTRPPTTTTMATTTTLAASCSMPPKVDEDGGGQATNCWTYTNTPSIPVGQERTYMLWATTGTCSNNTSITACEQTWSCINPGGPADLVVNDCAPPSGTMCTTCAAQCPGGVPAGANGANCRCGDGSYELCL